MIVPLPPTYSPPELAKLYRVKPDKILALIRAGELRAVDLRSPDSTRPRWRIPADAIVEFENRRSATPPPKPTRRRRRQADVTEYF